MVIQTQTISARNLCFLIIWVSIAFIPHLTLYNIMVLSDKFHFFWFKEIFDAPAPVRPCIVTHVPFHRVCGTSEVVFSVGQELFVTVTIHRFSLIENFQVKFSGESHRQQQRLTFSFHQEGGAEFLADHLLHQSVANWISLFPLIYRKSSFQLLSSVVFQHLSTSRTFQGRFSLHQPISNFELLTKVSIEPWLTLHRENLSICGRLLICGLQFRIPTHEQKHVDKEWGLYERAQS